MSARLRLIVSSFFVLALLASAPAKAEGDYADLSLSTIVKMFVRFGVLDIRKDDVIDFYGKVVECKIYSQYYLDDFKWQKVRAALRESVKQNIATFPTAFHYDAKLQLGKYDFKEKVYRFSEKTTQTNANVFRLMVDSSHFCTKDTPNILPTDYKFVLDQPIHMMGLPMSEENGAKLMARMKENDNKDLLIYTRFNMRVVFVPQLEAVGDFRGNKKGFVINPDMNREIRVDAQLDSIEYFEDPEYKKMIYRFMP